MKLKTRHQFFKMDENGLKKQKNCTSPLHTNWKHRHKKQKLNNTSKNEKISKHKQRKIHMKKTTENTTNVDPEVLHQNKRSHRFFVLKLFSRAHVILCFMTWADFSEWNVKGP